jgi:hypothetical protein
MDNLCLEVALYMRAKPVNPENLSIKSDCQAFAKTSGFTQP